MSNNTILHVAVIGLGNMGQYHVKHWQEVLSAALVAVVDPRESQLQRFATDPIVGYSNLDTLLDTGTIDAVSITTPTSTHFDIATRCIKAGIHVLVEKPIATTVDEGTQLNQLAMHHDVTLQVGHVERFNPAILTLKQWIETENLGAPISIHTERVSPQPHQIQDANVMIDLAVHDLDLIAMIAGREVETITRVSTASQLLNRDDSAVISLKIGRTIASVIVGWNAPIKKRTLVAYFQNGMVELDLLHHRATLRRPNQPDTVVTPSTPRFPLVSELNSFCQAIQTKSRPVVTADDGIFALQLALC